MPSITVTITTPASGPFQISKLLAGNTYAGAVSIAPVTPKPTPQRPTYLSIQADPANTTNFVTVGDALLAAAGTSGGKRLAAGVIDVAQDATAGTDPKQRFVNGSTTGVIVNIECY